MNETRSTESSRHGRDAFARVLRGAPEASEEPSPFLCARIHGAISRRSTPPTSPRLWRLGLALAAIVTLAGGITFVILSPASATPSQTSDFAEIARVAREVSDDLRGIDNALARRARAVLIEPVRREVNGLDRGLRSLIESFRLPASPGATG